MPDPVILLVHPHHNHSTTFFKKLHCGAAKKTNTKHTDLDQSLVIMAQIDLKLNFMRIYSSVAASPFNLCVLSVGLVVVSRLERLVRTLL